MRWAFWGALVYPRRICSEHHFGVLCGETFCVTYKLTCIIDHKSFDEPLVKTFTYHGETKSDVLAQIETLPFHRNNLRMFGRTAFKSTDGVKHSWKLKKVKE